MSIDTGLGITYKENYPTSGIGQSSQQFRDNFNVIRTAFENLHSAKTSNESLFDFDFDVSEADGSIQVTVTYSNSSVGKGPGALQFQEVSGKLRYWDGSTWLPLAVDSPGVLGAQITSMLDGSKQNGIQVDYNTATNKLEFDVTGSPVTNVTFRNLTVFTSISSQTTVAEAYQADTQYPAGTVVIFGGPAEVTTGRIFGTTKVAGIVVDNPAHIMNAPTYPLILGAVSVGVLGRAPCQVVGFVNPGDLIVAAGTVGCGQAATSAPAVGSVIGKALTGKSDPGIGTIVVAISRM